MSFTTLIIIGTIFGIILAGVVVLVVNQRKQQDEQRRLIKSLAKQLRQIETMQHGVPSTLLPASTQVLLLSLQKNLLKRMGDAQKSEKYKPVISEVDAQIEAIKASPPKISFEGLGNQKALQDAKNGLTALTRLIANLANTGQLAPEAVNKQLKQIKPILDRIRIQSFVKAAEEAEGEGAEKDKVVAHYYTQVQALTRGKQDEYCKKMYRIACDKIKAISPEDSETNQEDQKAQDEAWMQFDDSGELKKRNLYD